MTSHVYSGAMIGFDGHLIEVEGDATKGLPAFQIVGLGNKAIDEARERVRSAVANSGFSFPARRITINMAPANMPKHGTHFDVAIALSILLLSEQLRPQDVANSLFAGELALDGTMRPIRGAIHLAEIARAQGIQRIFLPSGNADQARLIDGVEIIGLASLQDLFRYLKGETNVAVSTSLPPVRPERHATYPHIDDIFGQEQAKRAAAIAAAGHHNILLTGPPGAGKTMLAKAMLSLLPPLTDDEKIATTKLHSLAGEVGDDILTSRPFRSPHHTSSRVSLIGGGTSPLPGEISLAHLGVLFLDEMPEYPRHTLEALRQPLEDKSVTIARANGSAVYPADFMLVATKNPCPCGYYGDATHECTCSPQQIINYSQRISGPLLDRIDLVINVGRVPYETLLAQAPPRPKSEQSSLEEQVRVARQRQLERYGGATRTNASLSSTQIKKLLKMSDDARELLLTASQKLSLSARSYFKIIKVARSIADLDGDAIILPSHISEALQYRLAPTP